jgi:hypothetical protein
MVAREHTTNPVRFGRQILKVVRRRNVWLCCALYRLPTPDYVWLPKKEKAPPEWDSCAGPD